jgi:hypothetical protein
VFVVETSREREGEEVVAVQEIILFDEPVDAVQEIVAPVRLELCALGFEVAVDFGVVGFVPDETVRGGAAAFADYGVHFVEFVDAVHDKASADY